MSAFIFSSFNGEDLVLRMNQCQSELLKLKKYNEVLSFGPIRFPITEKEKNYIQKFWNRIEKEKKLTQKILDLDIDSEKELTLEKVNEELSFYSQFNLIEARLLYIYYALKIENKGLVHRLLNEFIIRPVEFNYLERIYPYYEEIRLQDKIVEIIKFVEEKIVDNKLYTLFKVKLFQDANKYLSSLLLEEVDYPTSGTLNNLILSPNFGMRHKNIWIPWAYENMSEIKLKKLFAGTFKGVDWKDLLSLKYHFIEKPKVREKVYQEIIKLKDAKDIYKRTVFYEIIKNKKWSKYLSSKDKKFSINSIKSKRKFYQELVSKQIGGAYSVYSLFQLGDIDRKYFIFLLSIKSYGIPTTSILSI